MPPKYIMTRDEWIQYVISLLPDSSVKIDSKDNIAFDLSIEFGIISGMLSSGWYPEEAVNHFIERETERGTLDENEIEDYEEKYKSYQDRITLKLKQ